MNEYENYKKITDEVLRRLASAIVETHTVDDTDEGTAYCPFCYEDHSYDVNKHEDDCVVLLAQKILEGINEHP